MIDWNALHDWMDAYYQDVIDNQKVIRGFTFCSMHLETYSRDEIVISLMPAIQGKTPEDRAKSAIKEIVLTPNQFLEAFIPVERMNKIIAGEDFLHDSDWVWSDEH